MTRCSSENLYPAEGLGWRPPEPLPLRIESERLVIRAYTTDDVPDIHRAVDASRSHLLPWLPWCRSGYLDLESSHEEIVKQVAELDDPENVHRVIFGLFSKDSGELIGGSGIHDIRRDTASCETGYWIAAEHTRRGFGDEACRRTISWALSAQSDGGMGLRRVRIYTSDRNTASSKLIEKLGITPEVRQREDYFVEGVGCTTRLGWGVLAGEWDCVNHRAITP